MVKVFGFKAVRSSTAATCLLVDFLFIAADVSGNVFQCRRNQSVSQAGLLPRDYPTIDSSGGHFLLRAEKNAEFTTHSNPSSINRNVVTEKWVQDEKRGKAKAKRFMAHSVNRSASGAAAAAASVSGAAATGLASTRADAYD